MAILETSVTAGSILDASTDADRVARTDEGIDTVKGLRGVLLVVAAALFVVAGVTGGIVPSVALGLLYIVGVALLSTSPEGLPARPALVLGVVHVAAAAALTLL